MEITLSELKKYIKRRVIYNKKHGTEGMGFLGLVENRELSPEVKSLFYFYGRNGTSGRYDWVNGNEKLKQLIEKIKQEDKK